MISVKVQFLLIRIEHGLLFDLTPIALQRLADNIIIGRERATFKNVSIVSDCNNSEDVSKTEMPELFSEITTLPPLLSSDIALSIFTVKFILFIEGVFLKVKMVEKKILLLYMKKKSN